MSACWCHFISASFSLFIRRRFSINSFLARSSSSRFRHLEIFFSLFRFLGPYDCHIDRFWSLFRCALSYYLFIRRDFTRRRCCVRHRQTRDARISIKRDSARFHFSADFAHDNAIISLLARSDSLRKAFTLYFILFRSLIYFYTALCLIYFAFSHKFTLLYAMQTQPSRLHQIYYLSAHCFDADASAFAFDYFIFLQYIFWFEYLFHSFSYYTSLFLY